MHVIIYETSGDWAALIRRRSPPGIVLIETRSIDEAMDTLKASPHSMVLLQLHPRQSERILTLLRRIERDFHRAATVVLGNHHLRSWENLVREAGAIDYLQSPRQISRIIDLLEHHLGLARLGASETDSELSLEERIQRNLPWGD
ncbi:MAG TPA: hypothetical protein VGI75_10070 [Pirellulales bacterium]|jgi:DNA-binding NtrC family response regulator